MTHLAVPTSPDALRLSTIYKFWLPLALTWLIMSAEAPVANAVVARLADPKHNLAAFGVAIGLAMLVESPVIMMLSATITLAKNRQSYHKLRRFTHWLMAFATIGKLLVLIPPIFDFITDTLELDPRVSELSYRAFICFVPWSAAIAYRRFHQGLMIRNHETRKVAIGTIFRLSTMALACVVLMNFSTLDGCVVGAGGLVFGVICEAIATRFMARSVVSRYRSGALDQGLDAESPPLTFKRITLYYIPLALTSLIGMAVTPQLTFFMGRMRFPLESLAVMSPIDAFVFLFRSFGFSYQEVVLALMGENGKHRRQLRRFGWIISGFSFGLLTVIAFTPIADWCYRELYGLTDELAEFSRIPTMILVLLPALTVLLSYQRGLLLTLHKNSWVTISTLVEVALITICLIASMVWWNPVGIISASVALVIGRLLSNFYLAVAGRKAIADLPSSPSVRTQ